MTKDVESETERKIRDFIAKNPGSYLSKISEFLHIPVTVLELYLHEMEEKNIIASKEVTGYQLYYIKTLDLESSDNGTEGTWKRIYHLISIQPGIHLSKIAELLEMSKPLAEYHLLRMEKDGRITVSKDQGYKRYYVFSEEIDHKNKKILSTLRKEIPLKIVLYLADHPNAKHKEILKHLGVAGSTITYHMNALIKQDIVSVQRYGNERGYILKNKKEIVRLVVKYRLHAVADGFKDLWDGLEYRRW